MAAPYRRGLRSATATPAGIRQDEIPPRVWHANGRSAEIRAGVLIFRLALCILCDEPPKSCCQRRPLWHPRPHLVIVKRPATTCGWIRNRRRATENKSFSTLMGFGGSDEDRATI